jgi:hypothetical protein
MEINISVNIVNMGIVNVKIVDMDMKNHSKNVPNRNFVVELAHFGLKLGNNFRSRQLSSKLNLVDMDFVDLVLVNMNLVDGVFERIR